MSFPLPTEWAALRAALAFLTRLPVGAVATDPATTARAVAYYPAAGLLVGACLAGASLVPLPTPLAAVLLVALWWRLTGGLHLDGLADWSDALAACADREKTLALLRDPACGPAGAAAVVLVLATKAAALASLPAAAWPWALAAAPLAARSLLPLAFATTPCARREGFAHAAAMGGRGARPWLAGSAGLLLALALAGAGAAGVLLAGLGALFWRWRRTALERFGGLSGDGAGALVELAEALFLALLAGWLAWTGAPR
ncbi:MAG: adenosylcobinamide-GDP ribazoletransferase [Porticoccaceae bacterium]|nr:MAG: adenosylcobinamide-GDP ribazoletransferase [Porticoccaceae bacterium]